jgi:hypothetical protein
LFEGGLGLRAGRGDDSVGFLARGGNLPAGYKAGRQDGAEGRYKRQNASDDRLPAVSSLQGAWLSCFRPAKMPANHGRRLNNLRRWAVRSEGYRDVIIRVIDADRGEWGVAVVTRWSLGWSHAADSENEVRNYHCSSIS